MTVEAEPRAGDVVAALSRVMRDLPGIAKDVQSGQGYNYRGIEQVTREVQPLLARHGVVLVPHVDEWSEKEITVNNRPWVDVHVTVTYRAYGPGGIDDFVEARTKGIGRDNSDKGANKAMTQAYKYALLQLLCITDAKDDTDDEKHERDGSAAAARGRVAKKAATPRPVVIDGQATESQIKALQTVYSGIGVAGDDRKNCSAAILGLDGLASHKDLTKDQASTLIDQLIAVRNGDAELVRDDNQRPVGIKASR